MIHSLQFSSVIIGTVIYCMYYVKYLVDESQYNSVCVCVCVAESYEHGEHFWRLVYMYFTLLFNLLYYVIFI